jgi:type I restriction enzyme, R subunit
MFKNFVQSMDIILPHSAANRFDIPAKRFGFILAQTKNRYKDDSLDISGVGEKVKRLINEHLISLGISPFIRPAELMSDHFIREVEKNKSSRRKQAEWSMPYGSTARFMRTKTRLDMTN